MVSNMDIFSTIIDITKNKPIKSDSLVPSRSLLPILIEDTINWGDDAVFSEQEETRVVPHSKICFFQEV